MEIGRRQTVKITANVRAPDVTKLWQRRRLHTETFSGEKDPRRVFVYLRLTSRQIEISICNLARGSDHPGIPPAADQSRLIGSWSPDSATQDDFFVDLSFLTRVLQVPSWRETRINMSKTLLINPPSTRSFLIQRCNDGLTDGTYLHKSCNYVSVISL